MPAGAEEELHYHKRSQQFFFITKGKAVIEVDGVILFVHQGEGLLIEAGRQHKIMNKEEQTIEFILYSQPGVVNDRFSLA